MRCAGCGTENPDRARFCFECVRTFARRYSRCVSAHSADPRHLVLSSTSMRVKVLLMTDAPFLTVMGNADCARTSSEMMGRVLHDGQLRGEPSVGQFAVWRTRVSEVAQFPMAAERE